MDPHLEHPALWPDVNNRLIGAIRDAIAPRITPRDYVSLESRAYMMTPDDVVLVGRSDIAVIPRPPYSGGEVGEPSTDEGVAVLDVDVPMAESPNETYLEVREAHTGIVVTWILEILLLACPRTRSTPRAGSPTSRSGCASSTPGRTSLKSICSATVGRWPWSGRRAGRIMSNPRQPELGSSEEAKLYTFATWPVAAIPRTFPLPLREGEEDVPRRPQRGSSTPSTRGRITTSGSTTRVPPSRPCPRSTRPGPGGRIGS